VAVWHHLPSGGGKRVLFDHVRGLVERGHHVEAWCPSTADETFLPLRDIVPEHRVDLPQVTTPAVPRLLYELAGASHHLLARMAALALHARQVAGEIGRGRFDVLLLGACRWFAVPPMFAGLAMPSVLYLGEPYRPLYEAQPRLPWIAEAADSRRWWSPRGLVHWLGASTRVHPSRVHARRDVDHIHAFDVVLVNSLFSRESLLRAFAVDAHVCYPGVDPELFGVAAAPRARRVLSVGSFNFNKNPEFVVRAVAASRSRPVLRWVANSWNDGYVEAMKRLAAELGVSLELRQGLSEIELVREYQQAIALVYAPRLEPFGLAPLEANACGTPVVALAEGGVRETIVDGENGLLVEDPPGMAAAIDALVADPDRALALGRRAAEIVRRRWTLDAAVTALERHLHSAAHRGHRVSPPLSAGRSEDRLVRRES
jgi:glycosyltransferase involved in cell wall biosynthesis